MSKPLTRAQAREVVLELLAERHPLLLEVIHERIDEALVDNLGAVLAHISSLQNAIMLTPSGQARIAELGGEVPYCLDYTYKPLSEKGRARKQREREERAAMKRRTEDEKRQAEERAANGGRLVDGRMLVMVPNVVPEEP